MKLKILITIIFCFAFLTANAQSQTMTDSKFQQIIVETIHTYKSESYKEKLSFVSGITKPKFSDDSPETVLVEYLTALATGEVDQAIEYWTIDSKKLIQNKNTKISKDELIKSAKALNYKSEIEFVARITYASYSIVELKFKYANSKSEPTLETYALTKQDGKWKLTQELADDPVVCCRNNARNRIQRVGIPGGDFKKILDTLNK